jgi:hypothetical protein
MILIFREKESIGTHGSCISLPLECAKVWNIKYCSRIPELRLLVWEATVIVFITIISTQCASVFFYFGILAFIDSLTKPGE